jgi:hypothetical protein
MGFISEQFTFLELPAPLRRNSAQFAVSTPLGVLATIAIDKADEFGYYTKVWPGVAIPKQHSYLA